MNRICPDLYGDHIGLVEVGHLSGGAAVPAGDVVLEEVLFRWRLLEGLELQAGVGRGRGDSGAGDGNFLTVVGVRGDIVWRETGHS